MGFRAGKWADGTAYYRDRVRCLLFGKVRNLRMMSMLEGDVASGNRSGHVLLLLLFGSVFLPGYVMSYSLVDSV